MAARQRLGVGIIGAGNISSQYLQGHAGLPGPRHPRHRRHEARGRGDKAAEFGVKAQIGRRAARPIRRRHHRQPHHPARPCRGRPAGGRGRQARLWRKAARRDLSPKARSWWPPPTGAGVRVGSAPDTFLGGGHQQARAVIDSGRLGTIVGGTAFFACPGHEYWHPDPAFYYDVGGGPVLDMGPYYITDLVNLLGPVQEVQAMSLTPHKKRPIRSEPKKGQMMPVRSADPRHRHAAVRLRRADPGDAELRRAQAQPSAVRALTAPRARCWCLTPTCSAAT